MKTLGQRLRTLRLEKNLRQEDLARELGISKSAIGMYERGEREPPLILLREIANFFSVSADYLLGRAQREATSFTHYRELEKPGTDGNLRTFLSRKDLHWDWIPLAKKELRAVRDLMEVVIRERSVRYDVNPSKKDKQSKES